MIVNEAGASVWSASEAATRELPGYDVLERGAISKAQHDKSLHDLTEKMGEKEK